jgi:hypothetical protein
MVTPYELPQVLDNRRWLRRSTPFRHIVAGNVFSKAFYELLVANLDGLFRTGLKEAPKRRVLSRSMPSYDAYGMTFPPDYCGPFSLFMSRPWHDMLANLFGAKCTGHINCGIHHHAARSANGWVHNDLNPAWFVDYPSVDDINVVRHNICNYSYGDAFGPEVKPREVVRSVAMLFYLSNLPWSPGDGGCTGLYACKDDPVDRPVAMVPPINNSILIFECTPYSFHSFITNRRSPRNCVIMWLHCEKTDVIARWGRGKIVPWPKPQT